MSKTKPPLDFIRTPIQKFIQQEKSGGLVLGISVIIALILSNTFIRHDYFHFFEQEIGISINEHVYKLSIHHWINDGLMAIFFFVVGLELKREIVAGELSNPKQSLLPILAAIGGMVVPALIYSIFNPSPEHHRGWGIPMATDIAFALGVLYTLGNRIPYGLKIFLTALAIVDDMGAVVVIALFYTSDIHFNYLLYGFIGLLIMFIANRMGIKSILFYAIVGIFGVWLFFLLSGVHATIAAVLTAFMIPSQARIKESIFTSKINQHLKAFNELDPQDENSLLSNEQVHILEEIQTTTEETIPPSQKLEHAMHPLVTFIIIPIFAISNAGVNLVDMDYSQLLNNNILIGVGLGLLLGKVIGVVGFSWLSIQLKLASKPQGMNFKNLLGLGFLAAIGFTMSLFITNLAFDHPEYMEQSKLGIFIASILGGIIGYNLLKSNKA